MLAEVGSVGFKVENFTRKNMGLLENGWDQIRASLLMTAFLANDFGLNRHFPSVEATFPLIAQNLPLYLYSLYISI
jgi:hypothetical protein